jgi:hypothetical protein
LTLPSGLFSSFTASAGRGDVNQPSIFVGANCQFVPFFMAATSLVNRPIALWLFFPGANGNLDVVFQQDEIVYG